jgi:hypothetical protein
VAYETETHSGITDETGSFQYEDGERVTFRIGDTVLGETVGQGSVTPFDLVGIEPITNGRDGVREAGRAFESLVNLLVVLEAFDFDQNGDNGIEITAETESLFHGVELNLEKNRWRFRTDRQFRTALNQANRDALLEAHGRVGDPATVVQRLYTRLDIATGFFGANYRETDADGDGVVDEVSTIERDAFGYPVRETVQVVAVGGEVLVLREFGDWSQTILETHDLLVDGSIDTVYRTELNADGHPTLYETDDGADGVIDQTRIRNYNEFGEPVFSSEDEDGDGAPDRVTRWTYDDAGDRIETATDQDGDGVVDRIRVLFLDDKGDWARMEYDEDGDGAIDETETFQYDDAGNLIEVAYDYDADGVPDVVSRTEYDAQNREIRYAEDDDGDGIADDVSTTTYDEDGNPIRRDRDNDGDGTVDGVREWTYDDRGNLVEERADFDLDGVSNYERFYEYDENGFVTSQILDNDGDGVPDRITTATGVPIGWGPYFRD